MSRFLRLTNLLFNVNQIRRIDIKPNEYKIHLIPSELSGFIFLGSGTFQSAAETYTVSEKENETDYKMISEWILNEKTNNVWY
jgi:hypothetical protein